MTPHDYVRVGIVSSAQTLLKDAWDDLQHVDLISEAVSEALRGTGLGMSDVDFIINSGSDVLDGRSISNCGFLGAMGAHHKEESRVEEDGLWSLSYAHDKIASGSARVGVVIAYSKPSESSLAAYYSALVEPFYQRPVGLDHVSAHGLQAAQYLALHGVDEKELSAIVAGAWERAAANSSVDTPQVPGLDEIAASPSVASPLRALHLSRPMDGAVAVVVASEQVARRSTSAPVWISGYGSAIDSQVLAEREPGSFPAAKAAAQRAYARAGVSDPRTFGIAEVSAGSAAAELMVVEALGLAEPGQGTSAYDGAASTVLNPSGGALPADVVMATGLIRLHEAAGQLAGRLDRGAGSASSALVHGAGGLAHQNHCVFTLEV